MLADLGWSYFPLFDSGITFQPAITNRALHKTRRRENLVGPPLRFVLKVSQNNWLLARSIVGFKRRSIPLGGSGGGGDDVGKVERVNERERGGE